MSEDLAAERDHYRDAVHDYAQAFDAIFAIHTAKHGRPTSCVHCKTAWPCATARAALKPRREGL